jgi:hypothetical protein
MDHLRQREREKKKRTVYGRIILIWILKEEGVDWIRMAQVRVQL